MIMTKARLVAVALIALGALYLVSEALRFWKAVGSGVSTTMLGIALNLAPGVFLLLVGATVLARPTRTIIAFWLAPLWAPLFAWTSAVMAGELPYPAVVAIAAAFFAYVAMLGVGLPLFAHLRARNRTGLVVTAAVGGVTAALATSLGRTLIAFAQGPFDWEWWGVEVALDPVMFAVSAALGGLAAASFWAIVRPDRLAAAARAAVFS